MVGENREKGIPQIRYQQGYGTGFAGFQALCITVDMVIEFADSFLYFCLINFSHGQAVDDL